MSNIVEVASGNKDFSTLVAAVTAADLVATLSGTGPFTVFAPTNDAFAKLPAGTVENLVKPESKKTLSGILTFHVISGKFKASDLKDGQRVKTVNGEEVHVAIQNGEVKINGAKVVIADVEASNGVIHAIDSVLMPA